MTIDPKTLPEGAIVQCDGSGRGPHELNATCLHLGIARVFVPVPEGMTYADAEAALADAGAWVEVEEPTAPLPVGTRIRIEYAANLSGGRTYVHRDDLPPTDPDAELVESIAADLDKAWKACKSWDYEVQPAPVFSDLARAALAVVREHEATR
jgi:hypothetical protein